MSHISILIMGENPRYNIDFVGALWQKYDTGAQGAEQAIPARIGPFPSCSFLIDADMISCYGINPGYNFDMIHNISGKGETGVVIIVDSIEAASVLYGERLADYCNKSGIATIIGLLNTEFQKTDEFKTVFQHFSEINPMILPINLNNVKEAEVSLLILYNMILYKYVGFTGSVN